MSWPDPHNLTHAAPTPTPPLVLLPQVCLVGAGWALVALRPMAALAAPVRIEGFGAASNEATPVLRRNPASLPNVMEAATALKAVNDSDSRRQLTEMMGRLTARRAGLRDGPWMPLPPEGETTVTAAAGTPPVPIFRRSESSDSSDTASTDRSAHGIGQRDQSQGSLGGSAQGLDRAAPVKASGSSSALRTGPAVATGWSTCDRTGGAPAAVAKQAVAVPLGDAPTRGRKGAVQGPSPLSQEGNIKDAKWSQSSPNLSSFTSIEEVAMRREIVCDNCERQCPSPVDTKIGIFCSGECQWSAHFARRDLRKW